MVTPLPPEGSSSVPSYGYQRPDQHSQQAHMDSRPPAHTISKLQGGLGGRIPSAPACLLWVRHETTPRGHHDPIQMDGRLPQSQAVHLQRADLPS